jgi:hypothetical protein
VYCNEKESKQESGWGLGPILITLTYAPHVYNPLISQGYDVHMIIKALAKLEDEVGSIEIIPNSMEKYISVRTRKFR